MSELTLNMAGKISAHGVILGVLRDFLDLSLKDAGFYFSLKCPCSYLIPPIPRLLRAGTEELAGFTI